MSALVNVVCVCVSLSVIRSIINPQLLQCVGRRGQTEKVMLLYKLIIFYRMSQKLCFILQN